MSDLTFYYGATNGQTKSALVRLEEPNVMLNYASYSGEIWDSIENLFIDSGGYSFIKGMGEYQTPARDYLDYIKDVSPNAFALRDYPCEPDVLEEHNRTIKDHQDMTTDAHIELMNLLESEYAIDAEVVSVVQGRSVDEYLRHLDDLREHGVLTDYVGIGSVCGRHATKEIKPIVEAIDKATPSKTKIHTFGTKVSCLQQRELVERIDSMDSMAYSFRARADSREKNIMCGWRQHALHYLEFRREVLEALAGSDENQTELTAYANP